MFAKASFLAEKVQMSASENFFCAISRAQIAIARPISLDEPGAFGETAGVSVKRDTMARGRFAGSLYIDHRYRHSPPELLVTVIAAHCSADMALVPESVSRSIRMSLARI